MQERIRCRIEAVQARRYKKSFDEIRAELGLTDGQLRYVFDELNCQLMRRYNFERLTEIWSLYHQGYNCQQIGQQLTPSITRESVRQRLELIKRLFGSGSLERSFFTIAETSSQTGLHYSTVVKWCCRGRLTYDTHWRFGVNGPIVLEWAGLDELHRLIGPGNQIECRYPKCRRLFTPTLRQTNTCSTQCAQRWRDLNRNKGWFACPGQTSHRKESWQAELMIALTAQCLEEDEQWVSWSEAIKLSGLSHTQLDWAKRTQLLTTKNDPNKLWHGQPVRLYAVSQLVIAKAIYYRQTI